MGKCNEIHTQKNTFLKEFSKRAMIVRKCETRFSPLSHVSTTVVQNINRNKQDAQASHLKCERAEVLNTSRQAQCPCHHDNAKNQANGC